MNSGQRCIFEIVWEVGGIEFPLDHSVATEQATIRDVIPFPKQVGCNEDGLPSLRFELKRLLQTAPP